MRPQLWEQIDSLYLSIGREMFKDHTDITRFNDLNEVRALIMLAEKKEEVDEVREYVFDQGPRYIVEILKNREEM